MALSVFHRTLVILLTVLIGSVSADGDMNYIIASATVAILLFFLCIVMCCLFYNCSAIYRSFGYERIPKHELKKREVARTVISHTSSQQPYITPLHVYEKDDVSWVQRWRDHNSEERQDAVMHLGPEEEFRIETTLEEDSPRTAAVKAATDPDGLYAVVDKASIKRSGSSITGNGSVHNARDSTDLL